MWNDVKIGNTSKIGVTTIPQFDLDTPEMSISANMRGYRITLRDINVSATIMKSSAVGKKLDSLQNLSKAKEFRKYAETQIIKPERFKAILTRVAEEKGKKDKARDIRNLLGID
jgi:hypothetical protein